MYNKLSYLLPVLLISCISINKETQTKHQKETIIHLNTIIPDTAIIYENEYAYLYLDRVETVKILNQQKNADSITESLVNKLLNKESLHLRANYSYVKPLDHTDKELENFNYSSIVFNYLGRDLIFKNKIVVVDKRTNNTSSKIIRRIKSGFLGGHREEFCFMDGSPFFIGEIILGE